MNSFKKIAEVLPLKGNDVCECVGCTISRDPQQGYQPCHNNVQGTPPKAE